MTHSWPSQTKLIGTKKDAAKNVALHLSPQPNFCHKKGCLMSFPQVWYWTIGVKWNILSVGCNCLEDIFVQLSASSWPQDFKQLLPCRKYYCSATAFDAGRIFRSSWKMASSKWHDSMRKKWGDCWMSLIVWNYILQVLGWLGIVQLLRGWVVHVLTDWSFQSCSPLVTLELEAY